MNRRELIKAGGLAGAVALLPGLACARAESTQSVFRYCLNTSTIRGQNLGLTETIEIAAKAGYDGVELWVRDVQQYVESANSLKQLKKLLDDSGLKVENAIGFAPCFVDDDVIRGNGMEQMRREMDLMAEIGCTRIAAPPSGLKPETMPTLNDIGQRYQQLIELGRQTGVMPQLEFWGASGTLFQLGQALMVAASANDPDVRILPDVYHMFRGGSGFDGLKLINGHIIEVFHMNDYPSHIPREEQKDADRVFPGDGVAPLKQILSDLKNMGGEKVLSLELFNPSYWAMDPLEVAKTGLTKMKEQASLTMI